MNRARAFAIAALLLGGPAAADDQRTFTQWDLSRDGQVTEDEFLRGARAAGWFDQWDTDGDGFIGADEFDRVGFEAQLREWDADGDGRLDFDELFRGIYRRYDEDGDGNWTLGEWADVVDHAWFNP